MQSAYKVRPSLNACFAPGSHLVQVANGQEPEYTNLAKTRHDSDRPKFCETLDYIWLSDAWTVQSVKPIGSKASVEHIVSYPSQDEPSDHIMIFADLKL